MSTRVNPLYQPSFLDVIEDLERYQPGGFYPVSIGDVLSQGRYKVLHKLGFGGFSTVWLARDQKDRLQCGELGTLVTLKVLAAEVSSRPLAEIADIHIPQELTRFCRNIDHPGKQHLQVIQDHFVEEGPNGSHLCLVYPLAGPSVLSMSNGRGRGPRQLKGDLARKMANQVASAVDLLHSVGVVHGDLTSSNILFQISDEVLKWDDNEIYGMLGRPETEDVITWDSSPPGPSAPPKVVSPIDISCLCVSRSLKENIFLIDFGQSFFVDRMPKDYEPATPVHYMSPEAHFDNKISFASDVWCLACMIFEIRSGRPLFETFLASAQKTLGEMVEMFGRFPEPWWQSWEGRHKWFEESGEPKPLEVQKKGTLFPAMKSSIRQRLQEIGEQEDDPDFYGGPMIEKTETRLEEEELELLEDLLTKMLKYRPEERITIKEVMHHPWFSYE